MEQWFSYHYLLEVAVNRRTLLLIRVHLNGLQWMKNFLTIWLWVAALMWLYQAFVICSGSLTLHAIWSVLDYILSCEKFRGVSRLPESQAFIMKFLLLCAVFVDHRSSLFGLMLLLADWRRSFLIKLKEIGHLSMRMLSRGLVARNPLWIFQARSRISVKHRPTKFEERMCDAFYIFH
jgi:hypothetical protein